jgi:death-on-curing protein
MAEKRIFWLDTEQVIKIHRIVLRSYGGAEGGGHRGFNYEGVEAAVQAVKNSYYENLRELGAAYAVYIVQGHVFQDGNKRTGATSMLTFLDANGRRSSLNFEALARPMIEMQERAERGERTENLIDWLSRKV